MTKSSSALINAILRGVRKGITIAVLCRKHGIARGTFAGWVRHDPALAARLYWARMELADTLMEGCIAIADDSSGDWIDRPDGKGRMVDLDVIRRAERAMKARWRVILRLDRGTGHYDRKRALAAPPAQVQAPALALPAATAIAVPLPNPAFVPPRR